jgi:hypothetical protein
MAMSERGYWGSKRSEMERIGKGESCSEDLLKEGQ